MQVLQGQIMAQSMCKQYGSNMFVKHKQSWGHSDLGGRVFQRVGATTEKTVASSTAYEPHKEGRTLSRTIYVHFGMSCFILLLLADSDRIKTLGTNKQMRICKLTTGSSQLTTWLLPFKVITPSEQVPYDHCKWSHSTPCCPKVTLQLGQLEDWLLHSAVPWRWFAMYFAGFWQEMPIQMSQFT